MAGKCGQVGPRGGECPRKQYLLGGDFCWKHSEQLRRGRKLFCRICNEYVKK